MIVMWQRTVSSELSTFLELSITRLECNNGRKQTIFILFALLSKSTVSCVIQGASH